MIIHPTGKLSLDLYMDTDFCSLHSQENARDPNSARSRTGYIIMLSNCPLVWKSQLQTHISLSTLEAEYSALSHAMKTLLPLKHLLIQVVSALSIDDDISTSIHATVFKDNQSALYLATNHQITSHTKYFLVKWHLFWQHDDKFEASLLHVACLRGRVRTVCPPVPVTRMHDPSNRAMFPSAMSFLASCRYSANLMYAGPLLSQFSSSPFWCSQTTLE